MDAEGTRGKELEPPIPGAQALVNDGHRGDPERKNCIVFAIYVSVSFGLGE